MTKNDQNRERRTSSRGLSGITWLLLVLCLVGTSLESARAQTTALVITGDALPEGQGTFSGFEPFFPLNKNGQVAFVANLTGTQNPSTDGRGIFIADTKSVTQLVRTGETAPDGNGTFRHFSSEFGVMEWIVMNDNGTAAFVANLEGTSSGPTDNIGLFSASISGEVKQFVRGGDTAPDGNGDFIGGGNDSVGLSLPGVDNNHTAMFFGSLANTSGGEYVDDSGAFRSDGNSVTQLIRAGGTVPGSDDIFESILPGIASNLGGQVAISASLAFEFMGEPPGEDLERIYVHTGAVLKEVFRGGAALPDGNGIVDNAYSLSMNINGSVIFIGNVSDTGDFNLDVPRLFITDGVTLKQIARQNQLAPDEQVGPGELPFRFGSIGEFNRDSNIHDKVAFSTVLERNATPPDNRSSGIYLGDGNTIKLVLHQRDAVPGGNGIFGNVAVPLFLNNTGEIVFSASLEGTNEPSVDNRGIFFIGSDGVVQTVARWGMPLEGSTILSSSYLGDSFEFIEFDPFKNDRAAAGMNAINDAGQVPFWASLADGRSGIFLWKSSAEPPDEETIYADGFE